MSRIDNWDENERALYAIGTRALLDDLERQQQEWRESWALDSTSTDEMTRAHNERMRQLEEEHKAWLARFINGETDEPAPTHKPAQQISQDASGSGGEPATPEPGSAGRPHPHAAELERARAIRDMPMDEYAARRAELGVQSPTSMTRLFGQ